MPRISSKFFVRYWIIWTNVKSLEGKVTINNSSTSDILTQVHTALCMMSEAIKIGNCYLSESCVTWVLSNTGSALYLTLWGYCSPYTITYPPPKNLYEHSQPMRTSLLRYAAARCGHWDPWRQLTPGDIRGMQRWFASRCLDVSSDGYCSSLCEG